MSDNATTSTINLKEEAHLLVDNLPDAASWEDLMHRIYVRQAIEQGLADRDAERLVDIADVRTQFGLPQ